MVKIVSIHHAMFQHFACLCYTWLLNKIAFRLRLDSFQERLVTAVRSSRIAMLLPTAAVRLGFAIVSLVTWTTSRLQLVAVELLVISVFLI